MRGSADYAGDLCRQTWSCRLGGGGSADCAGAIGLEAALCRLAGRFLGWFSGWGLSGQSVLGQKVLGQSGRLQP